MSEEVNIRSLSLTAAAKLLKVTPATIRGHIRRGLPLVGGRQSRESAVRDPPKTAAALLGAAAGVYAL